VAPQNFGSSRREYRELTELEIQDDDHCVETKIACYIRVNSRRIMAAIK
jgi:hypothetical protein